jgi:hypothetical protein
MNNQPNNLGKILPVAVNGRSGLSLSTGILLILLCLLIFVVAWVQRYLSFDSGALELATFVQVTASQTLFFIVALLAIFKKNRWVYATLFCIALDLIFIGYWVFTSVILGGQRF